MIDPLKPGPACRRFDVALIAMADRGGGPPCTRPPGRGDWTSDAPAHRERAALLCRDACPLLQLCARAAVELGVVAGIWAGCDAGTQAGRAALVDLASGEGVPPPTQGGCPPW